MSISVYLSARRVGYLLEVFEARAQKMNYL